MFTHQSCHCSKDATTALNRDIAKGDNIALDSHLVDTLDDDNSSVWGDPIISWEAALSIGTALMQGLDVVYFVPDIDEAESEEIRPKASLDTPMTHAQDTALTVWQPSSASSYPPASQLSNIYGSLRWPMVSSPVSYQWLNRSSVFNTATPRTSDARPQGVNK